MIGFRKIAMALAATTMTIMPLASASAQSRSHHPAVIKMLKDSPSRYHSNARPAKPHGRYQSSYNNRGYYDNRRYEAPRQRHWAKGQRFDRRYATNYRVINNPRHYHLQPAPRGHQWVQSGNDAILIALAGGLIGAVIGGALR